MLWTVTTKAAVGAVVTVIVTETSGIGITTMKIGSGVGAAVGTRGLRMQIHLQQSVRGFATSSETREGVTVAIHVGFSM